MRAEGKMKVRWSGFTLAFFEDAGRIRLMTGLDIASTIEAKMERNAEKYPVDKAKGRSTKYTKL